MRILQSGRERERKKEERPAKSARQEQSSQFNSNWITERCSKVNKFHKKSSTWHKTLVVLLYECFLKLVHYVSRFVITTIGDFLHNHSLIFRRRDFICLKFLHSEARFAQYTLSFSLTQSHTHTHAQSSSLSLVYATNATLRLVFIAYLSDGSALGDYEEKKILFFFLNNCQR